MCSSQIPILERDETVALVWPRNGSPPVKNAVDSYLPHFKTNRLWFDHVQAASGWHVTEQQWDQVLKELVPNSMVFAAQGQEPVAVACALDRDDAWSELAWVAVASEHRGKRLGRFVCSELIRHLLETGKPRIFCSTQDERLAAIRIYLEIGFHPVFRENKGDRWRAICSNLGWPFSPRTWGWQYEHE